MGREEQVGGSWKVAGLSLVSFLVAWGVCVCSAVSSLEQTPQVQLLTEEAVLLGLAIFHSLACFQHFFVQKR